MSSVLVLEGIEKLILNDLKEGNIILDLVLRGADSVTRSDIETLYGVRADSPEAENLFRKVRE
ncbi:MAG TPA: hypothetical protein VFP96_07490, partial [Candidatus Acidoferrum sp.]|nr:hypothetical protein [Candidatus Acidoferrum sp.]